MPETPVGLAYPTVSSFFEDQGDFSENLEDPRDAVTFQSGDPGVKWFINEEGVAYDYPADLQEDHFPGDYHVAYDTQEAAEEASPGLSGWL